MLFSAEPSYDPDGEIVAYEWDLGDGDWSTGINVSHTYRSEGEYLVRLRVTDNEGETDMADGIIRVTSGGGGGGGNSNPFNCSIASSDGLAFAGIMLVLMLSAPFLVRFRKSR